MKKFVLLYSGGAGMMATEADRQAEIQRWIDWYTGLGPAIVDGGNPFEPGARQVASDGQVSNLAGQTVASGYTIVTAGSIDDAAQMAKGCPVLRAGGSLTVLETHDVM